MEIYNNLGVKVLDIPVDDTSYRYRAIMGDNSLTLKYSLAEHVELPVGSYCDYQGQRFTLIRPEALKMQHSRSFEYTVTLDTPQANAKMWKFRNTVDGRLKFPLTAKPHEHLEMFVANMNRRDSGWTIGGCIEGEEKVITYDHDYCWDALAKMAEEFNTEFEIDNKTVYLRRVERFKGQPLSLSYGRGNGFKSGIGRSNDGTNPPVEILFCQGGTENIDPSKYGGRELHLPKNAVLRYDGSKFEGETGYDSTHARAYVTDAQGLSIRRSDRQLSSQAEDSLDLTHIYPKRVGTVSGVVVVDAQKCFYDFIDSSIPASLNYEECLIAGETMTVVFQSGELAGHGEFEVKYYHSTVQEEQDDGTIITKAAKRFEIVPKEEDGITMPSSTFIPAVGDKYAVFGCQLPQAYINDAQTKTGAEWDMYREGVRYMYDNEEALFSFSGELDGIWAKRDWVNIGGHIVLGGYISFTDSRFQSEAVLVRIIGIKDYVNNPHSPEIELSNKTVSAGFVTTIKQAEAQEVYTEEMAKAAMSFTKRRFRDAKETIDMLNVLIDFGFDHFTEAITPITVQTMSMLVGDESLQFRFVNRKTAPISEVPSYIAYNQQTKVLTAPATILQHLTLGINTMKASHTPSEYKFWDVAAYTSARLDTPSKKYYFYVRANKANTNAVFLLSETAHAMNDTNYYWFLVGVLNSEFDGERSFATLYGFTEILPGRITTDRILSTDGNTYFDLSQGEIGGNIKIKAGSSGLTNLSDYSVITDAFNNVGTELNVLGDGISAHSTAIDTINNTISTAGWITRADGNTWWAGKALEDGNTIISYINQTATTTTIASSKINLVGAVTFQMFGNSLQSLINGKADSSSLGDLATKNTVSSSDLATALANTINGKANSSDLGALATLDSVAWTNLATNLKNEINGKVNSSLLSTAFVSKAMLDSTIIVGGYIETSLLNVTHIAAVSGSIAGFDISNTNIVSTSGAYDGGSDAAALSSSQFHLYASGNSKAYMGYSASNCRAEIGLNTYNGSSQKKIMCDLRDTTAAAYTYTKIGLYVDIYDTYNAEELAYNSNVTENIGATAIYINRGHVTGLKRHLRHISGNNTAYMTKDDSLVHFHNTTSIDAYLPSGCEDGQEIWVMPWNTTVKVKARSGQYIHRGGNNSETEVSCSGSQYHIFIYCAYNGRWVFGYLNE